MEDEEGTENKVFSKLLLNSDLFDPAGDESESDEERPGHTPSRSPTPPTLPATSSPPPKGRRRKTSTAGKERKRSRAKKSEVQYMHSESQRLMRESSMSLPKYQPKTKTLDSFLTKLRSRGPTPKSHTSNKENKPLNQRAPDSSQTVSTSSVQDLSSEPALTEPSPSSSVAPPTCAAEPSVLMAEAEPAGQCGVGDSGSPEGLASDGSSKSHDCEETADTPCQTPAVDSNPLGSGAAEHSCSGGVATGDIDIEPVGKAKQQRSESREPSKPALNQTTLLGLFAARTKELQRTATEQPPLLTPQPPSSPDQPPSSPDPPPSPGPKLSSAVDFVLEGADAMAAVEVPGQSRELTGVELLQQRFAMHALRTRPQGSEVNKEGEGPAKESGGVAPLVPGDVIAKLMDKPGAVRQHWRSALRQQLSQRRAEERKEAEEMRRLFSEDVSPLEEEEEGELSDRDTTDAETSDEEYEQDEAAANAGSDVCSVEDEEGGDEGEGSGNKSNDGFSDDDELYTVVRPARKPRLLESDDDEESNDGGNPLRTAGSVTATAKTVAFPAMYEDTYSMSAFGDVPSSNARAGAGPRSVLDDAMGMAAEGKGKRALGSLVEPEEASMPPLVFSESFESEESSGADSPTSLQPERAAETAAPTAAAGNGQLEEIRPGWSEGDRSNSDGSSAYTSLPEYNAVGDNMQTAPEGKSSALPIDSGLGTSLECRSQTQPVPEDGSQIPPEEEPYTEPVLDGDSTSVGDNSLELSFQWGASLPPAQPRRDPSLELFGSAVSKRERSQDEAKLLNSKNVQDPFDSASQWDDAPPPASQSVSMDEETQFLDANGFLCLRKEKKSVSPVGGSTLKSIVDPSQEEPSSSELLVLCSGGFDETQNTTTAAAAGERERGRNLSDDSSSQTVRELLGLPVKSPRQGSLTKLLASGSVPSEDTTQGSCMSEVLGLCSGVFPSTQLAATRRHPRAPRSMRSAGTSDGMSSESEDGSGSGGEAAVLRWAQRQGRTGETGVLRVAPLPTPLDRYASDSEDEDMPMLVGRKRRSRPRPKPTKGERLAEFVESEAELSGEEEGVAGEEEEEEPFSGPDEYEEEEGAGEDLPLSDSELWDQVNKAHMKHTLSDDKADLQDFKERFLRDGDLFEDGLQMKNGFFRTRRYAKAGSEQGSVDLFAEERGEESEGEAEAVGSQAEALRRKDRLEREEFIKKCRERENSLMAFDEDSQSILDIIRDTTSHSLLNTPSVSRSDELPRPASTGCKRTRCGSFLKHNTATLRRLSSLTASTPSVSVPGKNFVFQRSDTHTPVHIKSTGGSKATPLAPVVKKPRLDRSSSLPSKSNSSIFSVLK